ncbi:MAG: glycosyltransferase family 4 protein [Deltaproteobacteria bacterium]|nr:glycosyltransferase family 4 protein [Deltaproteobacteria bacterium]
MRVVILSETFAKNMGYAGRMLPKYLARLGVDVHMVTMDLLPYHQIKDFKETYDVFTGSTELTPGTIESFDGYTLHVLAHKKMFGYMRMVGLMAKLRSIQPDIVQTFAAIGPIPLDAALAKPFIGYKFFTGNHTTASVFPLAQREAKLLDRERLKCIIARTVPGRFVSLFTEKCYGATKDCADVAVRFFGVQKTKINLSLLGVDTELFFPISEEDHKVSCFQLRQQLGFSLSDIVCVYTGRFSDDKNPLALAQAISRLSIEGEPYRGLFVGHGAQAEAIKALPGCTVHPFVPVNELPLFYRVSDIGVWPTQESTSMLDAAACGLPIIVNDTMVAVERIKGNGISYKLNDVDHLMCALQSLRDPVARNRLGECGAKKMMRDFSWDFLAKQRLRDYEASLGSRFHER